MLVQLNKCVVVCGSDLQRGHRGDGCLSSLFLFKYECSLGHVFVLSWARVRRAARGGGECCFGVMYCEWYGVCDFVVMLVVAVCANYGGVNVFHVCLNFCVVYGVGVCVNVYGVVCVVVCCLFLTSGCCLLCCSGCVGCCDFCLICDACSWRCSFMGSMCVSSCRWCAIVSVVLPVAILSAVFCVISSLLMFVSDAIGDHMVDTYSSMGLFMGLYVARIVSFYFPHVVDYECFEYLYCLVCFCCCDFYVFVVCKFGVESQS